MKEKKTTKRTNLKVTSQGKRLHKYKEYGKNMHGNPHEISDKTIYKFLMTN